MRAFLAILVVPLLAAACGSGPSGSATPVPSAAPSAAVPSAAPSATPRYAVETGADKLILRIADEGGFIAPGYLLSRVPQFALYGDGRVIVPGPIDTIYPGPLAPNLRQLQVTPEEIQKIMAAADAASLLGPDASYVQPNVSDASTTVFTTTVAGSTHTIGAYALGLGGGFGIPNQPARAKLDDFRTKMTDLAGFLGRTVSDAAAYQPSAMRVFVGAVGSPAPGDSTQQVVTWPLTADPATAGQTTAVAGIRCVVVSGGDLTAFMTVARNATAATLWAAPSGRYSVSLRPLYPEETGCPATAG